MQYDAARMKALLQAARLRDNDAVFAFDVGGNMPLGLHAERKALDADWNRWILEQYGSLASAEKDWRMPAPRETARSQIPPMRNWQRMAPGA